MPASKSERLLNLVILLLVSRTYVTKERIRQLTEPYRNCASDEAFEKMFERDKEDLRALGIPIEVGHPDRFFDDEQGYRIKRDAFELPELEFAPEEAAVLGLAARVWEHAGLAGATSDALVKLRAAGCEVDREAIDAVRPSLAVEEPSFDPLWEAVLQHRAVEFDYRTPGSAEPRRRHLEPWGLVTAHGRWYVVGRDTDREEERMFRLSRIDGQVEVGRPGAFVVPEGTDLRALGARLAPPPADQVATIRIRAGAALDLRRRAEAPRSAGAEPAPEGWERLEVRYGSTEDLVRELLGYTDAVVVEGPAELRTEIVSRLTTLDAGKDAS